MRQITVVAFVTLASILGVGSALAQSNQEVRVTVPFNFTVGARTLPAGTYSITPVSDSLIEIENKETRAAMLAMTAADSNRSQYGSELVFDKLGGQYFLREILCPSADMNMGLPSSKLEKRVSLEEARLHNRGSQVLVAAK